MKKHKEADFGILFRHWLKANPRHSCAFELKQTSQSSISFSCVEPHQIAYLEAIHSDVGALIRVQGTNGEPDYIYLRNAPACIVIKFPRTFHIISIDAFTREKEKNKLKSLTNERAFEISIVSVKLDKK